jgi:hypothetical protein
LNSDITLATLLSARCRRSCTTNIFTACRLIFVSGTSPNTGRMWLRRWLRYAAIFASPAR